MLRLSRKRALSKMSIFDFVVVVAIGSILASIITSDRVSLTEGIVALGTLAHSTLRDVSGPKNESRS